MQRQQSVSGARRGRLRYCGVPDKLYLVGEHVPRASAVAC